MKSNPFSEESMEKFCVEIYGYCVFHNHYTKAWSSGKVELILGYRVWPGLGWPLKVDMARFKFWLPYVTR